MGRGIVRLLAFGAFVTILGSTGCSQESSQLDLDEGPLVFVPMGNSAMYYPDGGLLHRYSEQLAEDFDVEVDLRDWTQGSDRADSLIDRIRTDRELQEDLSAADVVLLDVPFGGWAEPLRTVAGAPGGDRSGCGGDDGEACLREALRRYQSNTETLFRELTTIADPSETLVRVIDYPLVHIADLGDALAVVAPYWVEGQQYVDEVASEHGIPVAHVMERFCGPDCLVDPVDAGLMLADQEHPTVEGADIMMEMVHDLGYGLRG